MSMLSRETLLLMNYFASRRASGIMLSTRLVSLIVKPSFIIVFDELLLLISL